MKRYWRSGSLVLLFFIGMSVWLDPTRVLWGLLRGQSFYKGRPTSYWSKEVARLEGIYTMRWSRHNSMMFRGRGDRIGIDVYITYLLQSIEPSWWARVLNTAGMDHPLRLDGLPGWQVLGGTDVPPSYILDPATIPVLQELAKDNNAFVRWAALRQLSFADINDESFVLFVAALNDPDIDVRLEAALNLVHFGRAIDQPVVPILMEGLSLEHISDSGRFWCCIQKLRKLGSEAKAAVPALVELLDMMPPEDFPGRREAIVDALRAIDPEAAAKAGVK